MRIYTQRTVEQNSDEKKKKSKRTGLMLRKVITDSGSREDKVHSDVNDVTGIWFCTIITPESLDRSNFFKSRRLLKGKRLKRYPN